MLIGAVGDEHSRNGVVLAVKLREMYLPYARDIRRMPLLVTITRECRSMREKLRIDVAMTRGDQKIHSAKPIGRARQIELPVQ